MRTDAVLAPLLFLVCCICPAVAAALGNSVINRVCIPEAVTAPPFGKGTPVPVGCQLVDCCPGCPGPGPVDWRVSVDGKVLAGAELRFEGLTANDLKQLKIAGAAKLQGDRIVLGR